VKRENELYPFRRHLRCCKFFGLGGREIALNKCACPFHVDGLHHGTRVRQSLKTTSRQLVNRRLTALIRKLDEQRREGSASDDSSIGAGKQTVSVAVERFLRNQGEMDQNGHFRGAVQYATWRKYRTKLNCFSRSAMPNAFPNSPTSLLMFLKISIERGKSVR
jgi:hypothetical protein